ncbi:hypothetical protein GCM10009123_02400 [Kangiella japonica]|uniref:ABC transporter substrate-binding protein n=1 Tax=Kangiella japonica TaxID=647384 RepID=A0ABP3CE51_9GAMM
MLSSIRLVLQPAVYLLKIILILLICAASLPSIAEHVEPPTVVKVNVLSPFSTQQERALLYSFRQTLLEEFNVEVTKTLIFWQRQSDWQQQLELNQPDLIIAIGNDSFNKIKDLGLSTPILAMMLSKDLLQQLRQHPRDNIYAITHTQPTERFVQLAKSLNVYQAQIGSFVSPQIKDQIQEFERLARFYDLSYRPVIVEPKRKGRDAIRQLSLCCSVIILESDYVFRPGKVRKSILVNAYRQRIIVIAHSESVLKEGAMLTLFTQPHNIGKQGAALYNQILNDTVSLPYQYPASFSISINRKIARLLGYDDLKVGALMRKIETLDLIQKTMGDGKMQTP